ncbi:MAG: Protease [Ilumatobacteraceae bacterium]|nr:Protease [Ilumatobacteraceae bacterium]
MTDPTIAGHARAPTIASTVTTVREPVAPQIPHTWHRPTGDVEDPWAWLRDRDDPATIEYLEEENAYADVWFDEHAPAIEHLFDELRSRVQETDLSAPVRKDDWWYVSRTEEGSSYPIHCRGRSASTATEHALLDENVEAAGKEYFSLSSFTVSPDHRLLAWSSDDNGSERYTLRIRDLATGSDLDDVITDTTWGGTAWSSDDEHVFYVTPDEQMRPHRVWRHRLGTAQADDVLVYEDPDERFFVGVGRTRSGEWIVIESGSKLSSEAHLVPAGDPTATPVVVRPRVDDLEYSVDHWGDSFVVVTNLDAEDFRVMTAPLDAPGEWTELVAHQPGRRITSVDPFADHLVLHEWADAQTRLRILFRDGTEQVLELGDEPHDVDLDSNPNWETNTIRFDYQSFTTSASVYEQDLRTGERTLLKQTPVPNADLTNYVATREWATAPDGTKVPVDIVRRADVTPDGTNPCLVYGYGSYEMSMAPWFSAARLSLLDRGVAWALVHPRGGGELGRRWYLDGKLLHKRNTFTDTIACAEHLVAQGWAAPGKMAVRGGSAGGLLVGACTTMRPDLFAAVVAEVPFVDVVSTMSDPSLPLTVTEWEEWGDPRQEPWASYIESYSPYDNTIATAYPAVYVTAGLNDPRVSYHEPAKWVAKLRALRTNRAPLVFKCEMGAGHGGPSGRYERWRDEAKVTEFVLSTTR